MGVSTVPHTFLVNGDGKIVWEHKGYIDGDEDELYEQIEHITNNVNEECLFLILLIFLQKDLSFSR